MGDPVFFTVTPTANRTMTYDGMHRLKTSSGSWGLSTWNYDYQSNIINRLDTGGLRVYDYVDSKLDTVKLDGTPVKNYDYDTYGNVNYIQVLGASPSSTYYTYDDSNQLREVDDLSGVLLNFDYDHNNLMVRRAETSKDTVYYVYAANGSQLGEYTGAALLPKEYIYLGAKLIAVHETIPPTANAGPDQALPEGSLVSLDGSASTASGASITQYAWLQLSGPTVTLNDPGIVNPTFTAPQVIGNQDVVLELTVTDSDGVSATDTVIITVQTTNLPPVANAGPDQIVFERASVSLTGLASTDPENAITSYLWIQTQGPGRTLTGGDTATPTFTAPDLTAGDVLLEFMLTVTDDEGLTDTDTVIINVMDYDNDSDLDGLADGWENAYFGNLNQVASDDPDGDGLTNLMEMQQGTNPTVAEPIPGIVQGVETVAGDSEAGVYWNSVTGTAQYNLYWSTTPGVTTATGTLVSDVSSPYIHTGLTNGTTYYYIVTAANNAGESAASSEVNVEPGTKDWSTAELLSSPMRLGDVASDGKGNLLVAWSEINASLVNVWYRLYDVDSGWTAPTLLDETETYHAYAPKVAMNSKGQAVAVYGQNDGTRINAWARLYDPDTQTWDTAQLIDSYNGSAYENGDVDYQSLRVKINESGTVVATWLQEGITWAGATGYQADFVWTNVYQSGGWGTAVMPGPQGSVAGFSDQPSVTVGEDSTAAIIWERRVQSTSLSDILVTRYTGTGWTNGVAVDTSDALVQNPDIAMDTSGNMIAIWEEDVGNRSTSYAALVSRYTAATTSWSTPEEIGPLARNVQATSPAIAISNSGIAVAVWSEDADVVAVESDNGAAWLERGAVSGGTWAIHSQFALNARGYGAATWVDLGSTRKLWVADYQVGVGWGTATSPMIGTDDVWQAATRLAVGDFSAALLWRQEFGNPAGSFNLGLQGSLNISRFAVLPPPPNVAPTANAGPDQLSNENLTVNLDGSASSDSDGTISSYAWVQTAGPAITLNGADTATPSFTTPVVASDTILTFELTVTDNEGATAIDSVNITVRAAPLTTGNFARSVSQGKVNFDITLSTNETATTYFRFTGQGTITAGGADIQDWQTYTGTVHIILDKNGTGNFDYYSVDGASNTEAVQTEVLQ